MAPRVQIADNEPVFRYQGDGAAYGGMFVSALGPSGIAVGIAIDQRVAADIENQLFNESPEWRKKLSARISGYIDKQCSNPKEREAMVVDCNASVVALTIDEVRLRKKQDLVSVELSFQLSESREHSLEGSANTHASVAELKESSAKLLAAIELAFINGINNRK